MEQGQSGITAEALGKRLGERIAFYRKRKNFTQATLAELIGVDSLTISRFERGQTLPSLLRLFEIGHALGIGMGDMLGEASPLTSDLSVKVDAMSDKDRALLNDIAGLLQARNDVAS